MKVIGHVLTMPTASTSFGRVKIANKRLSASIYERLFWGDFKPLTVYIFWLPKRMLTYCYKALNCS